MKKYFEFIILKGINLVNKRSIAFKYSLQSLKDYLPESIIPKDFLNDILYHH